MPMDANADGKIIVYYLDDEELLLEAFQDRFSTNLIEIKTFSQVVDLLSYSAENPPDLFVLDYRLPNTNGDQVAKSLQSDIPKVLVSGDLTIQTESKFTKMFSKPYHESEIEDFLNAAIEKKRNHPSV